MATAWPPSRLGMRDGAERMLLPRREVPGERAPIRGPDANRDKP
jgi:hypothetical protein